MLNVIVRFCLGSWLIAASFVIAPSSLGQTSCSQADGRTHTSHKVKSVNYINKTYGFRFSLPESWRRYSISVSQWQGGDGRTYAPGEVMPPPEKGPLITIGHPRSTETNPRQNIPIMIFTNAQWQMVEEGRLILSAAPVGPNELGRNLKYVFALPARYNYAFPDGWEEVQEIISNRPLHAF